MISRTFFWEKLKSFKNIREMYKDFSKTGKVLANIAQEIVHFMLKIPHCVIWGIINQCTANLMHLGPTILIKVSLTGVQGQQ